MKDYLKFLIKLLAVLVGGAVLLNIVGCQAPKRDKPKRGVLTTMSVTSQWFVNLDANTETGYSKHGYDVLERPDGLWRATLPPLFDGGWGPETDCTSTGPNLKGRREEYSNNEYLSHRDERRLISCTQLADIDHDGDVDLRDAAEARDFTDFTRVVERITGPS